LDVASVLHLRQPKADGNNPANATADWAKQHNDDLEDRAIGAAGNHGFYAKRTHDGGEDRGVEGALCYRLPKPRFGLKRPELADRDSVRFLRDCEADGMKLENCPAYVRDWMEREKD